jgi:hypothetical protein
MKHIILKKIHIQGIFRFFNSLGLHENLFFLYRVIRIYSILSSMFYIKEFKKILIQLFITFFLILFEQEAEEGDSAHDNIPGACNSRKRGIFRSPFQIFHDFYGRIGQIDDNPAA